MLPTGHVKIIRNEPLLTFEAIGAVLLVWCIADRQIWQPARLKAFIRSGQP